MFTTSHDDVWMEIIQFLPSIQDVHSIGLTSKYLHQVSQKDYVWSQRLQRDMVNHQSLIETTQHIPMSQQQRYRIIYMTTAFHDVSSSDIRLFRPLFAPHSYDRMLKLNYHKLSFFQKTALLHLESGKNLYLQGAYSSGKTTVCFIRALSVIDLQCEDVQVIYVTDAPSERMPEIMSELSEYSSRVLVISPKRSFEFFCLPSHVTHAKLIIIDCSDPFPFCIAIPGVLSKMPCPYQLCVISTSYHEYMQSVVGQCEKHLIYQMPPDALPLYNFSVDTEEDRWRCLTTTDLLEYIPYFPIALHYRSDAGCEEQIISTIENDLKMPYIVMNKECDRNFRREWSGKCDKRVILISDSQLDVWERMRPNVPYTCLNYDFPLDDETLQRRLRGAYASITVLNQQECASGIIERHNMPSLEDNNCAFLASITPQ